MIDNPLTAMERIAAYLDGEMNPSQQVRYWQETSADTEFGRRLAQFREINEMGKDLPMLPMDSFWNETLMAQFNTPVAVRPTSRRLASPWPRRVAFAAVLLTGLFAAVLVTHDGPTRPERAGDGVADTLQHTGGQVGLSVTSPLVEESTPAHRITPATLHDPTDVHELPNPPMPPGGDSSEKGMPAPDNGSETPQQVFTPAQSSSLRLPPSPLDGERGDAQIDGTVYHEDGSPASGSQVSLRISNFEPWEEDVLMLPPVIAVTTTDSDGQFHFGDLSVQCYQLSVRCEGHALLVRNGVLASETKSASITLRLERLAPYRVLIHDEEGAPVPHAPAVLWTRKHGPFGYRIVETITADAKGRFAYESAHDARTYVAIRSPHHAPIQFNELAPDCDNLFVLERGFRMTGYVIDDAGYPVIDARVSAQRLLSHHGNQIYTTYIDETYSDRDGRFTFSHIPAGEMHVVVQTPSFTEGDSGPLQIYGDSIDDVTIILKPGYEIVGRVAGTDGRPATTGRVSLSTREGDLAENDAVFHFTNNPFGHHADLGLTWTDRDGAFRFPAPSQRSYRLRAVQAAGPYWLERAETWIAPSTAPVVLNYSRTDFASLIALLMELNEKDERALLGAFGAPEDSLISFLRSAQGSSLLNRLYALPDKRPAAILDAVSAACPGFRDRALNETGPSAAHPHPFLAGHVVYDGSSLSDQCIVQAEFQWKSASHPPARRFRTDPDGRFVIPLPLYWSMAQEIRDVITPMVMTLHARSESGHHGKATVEVPPAESPRAISVTLREGRSIRGVVRDPAGKPVHRAEVIIAADHDHAVLLWPEVLASVRTDSNGRFVLRGLPDGHLLMIGAWAPRCGLAIRRGLSPDANEVILQLPPESIIRGQVLDSEGRGRAAARVTYEFVDSGGEQTLPYFASRRRSLFTVADSEGRFEITGLETHGSSSVALSAVFRDQKSQSPVVISLVPGKVAEDVTLHVSGRRRLHGRVVAEDSGKGIPDCSIYRVHGMLPRELVAVTGSDGQFESPPLPPGEVRLVAISDGYADAGRSHTVPALIIPADVDTFSEPSVITMEQEGRLRIRLVDDAGQPATGVLVMVVNGLYRAHTSQGPSRFRYYDTVTGEDGMFEIHGAPQGATFAVSLSRDELELELNLQAPSSPYREEVIVFSSSQLVSIEGTVVLGDGSPVTQGEAMAQQWEGEGTVGEAQSQAIIDGQFRFDGLQPGEYSVLYNYSPQSYEMDESERFVLAPGETKTGIRVLADKSIRRQRNLGNKDKACPIRVDLSDFDLPRLLPGEKYGIVYPVDPMRGVDTRRAVEIRQPVQTLMFLPQAYHDQRKVGILARFPGIAANLHIAEVDIPSEEILIKPSPPGTLTGEVVDAETGRLVQSFRIGIRYRWAREWDEWSSHVNGQYSIVGVGDHIARLRATANGYAPSEFETVLCRSDQITKVPAIQLQRGLRITGSVVDSRGVGVEQAEVIFSTRDNDETRHDWGIQLTGRDGEFSVQGLLPGAYTVIVRHPKYKDLDGEKVTIVSAATRPEFTIQQVGEVHAYVHDEYGNIVRNADVRLDGQPFTPDPQASRYILEDVDPGTATVVLSPYLPGMDPIEESVTVLSGEVAIVHFRSNSLASKSAGILDLAGTYSEEFESELLWTNEYEGHWGTRAVWEIMPGGSTGSYMQTSQPGEGSSAKTLVFAVSRHASLEVSIYMKAPPFSQGHFWMDFSYRLGEATAAEFDTRDSEWVQVKKFDSKVHPQGNGDQWTRYSAVLNTGEHERLTIGLKIGSLGGPCPSVGWDSLQIR